jgi:hypothetical protein
MNKFFDILDEAIRDVVSTSGHIFSRTIKSSGMLLWLGSVMLAFLFIWGFGYEIWIQAAEPTAYVGLVLMIAFMVIVTAITIVIIQKWNSPATMPTLHDLETIRGGGVFHTINIVSILSILVWTSMRPEYFFQTSPLKETAAAVDVVRSFFQGRDRVAKIPQPQEVPRPKRVPIPPSSRAPRVQSSVTEHWTPWLEPHQYPALFEHSAAKYFFPVKVEGKIQNGYPRFRAAFAERPAGTFHYWSEYNMGRWYYERKDAELTNAGYVKIWEQSFVDVLNIERFQATWVKK